MKRSLPAIVGLLGFLAPVAGQEQPEAVAERPSMAATRVEQGPNVDGDLSDPVWARSEVGADFVQHEPLDGVPATEQTEIRVVFTGNTLFFGITAFDANPEAIVAREMERDSRIFQDDSIILLDTFHDRRNAYTFETNLNGARSDTLVTDEGRDLNLQWDGIWHSAAQRTASGWTVEIAIPFSTLRFDPSAPAWGFNVQRHIAHKRETTHWSALPREISVLGQTGSLLLPIHRVSMAGELTGLDGLSESRHFEVKPFVVGVDFDYKPTSRLGLGGFWTSSGLSEEPTGNGAAGGAGDAREDAYGFSFDYKSRDVTIFFDAQDIEEDYFPAAGFLLRKNVRRLHPMFQWFPRIEKGIMRTWYTHLRADYYETLDERQLESRRIEIQPIGMRTTGEDRWRFGYVGETENLVEPFEVAPGIVIPPGYYRFDALESAITSNPSRPLSTRTVITVGDFYNGRQVSGRALFFLKLSRHLQTETRWIFNDVELPQGAFDVALYSQGVNYTFNPNLRLNAIIQYNDHSGDLGTNIRLHWIYKPGSDLFVVYNENWMAEDLRHRQSTHRQIAVKFTYLIQP